VNVAATTTSLGPMGPPVAGMLPASAAAVTRSKDPARSATPQAWTPAAAHSVELARNARSKATAWSVRNRVKPSVGSTTPSSTIDRISFGNRAA
jgi:hypothetical protein